MHWLDWLVLFVTLGLIAGYGIYKTRQTNTLNEYLNSGGSNNWWAVGLSIMATQASAITFLSTPGLGYESGLKFVQFYFGMPLALMFVAFVFAPLFHRQKVFTAYEYLENRFDGRVRTFTAIIFLLQRGLAAGITIYAPSIILTLVLGWPLYMNILIIGVLVTLYTWFGGNKAVTQTHKQQMAVIFAGLLVASYLLYKKIEPNASLSQILDIAKITGRLNSIDTRFDLNERYNLWSGLLGGTFLMLAYFGTDQSQVQRYLSGKSLKEIRTGLFFNAIFKIPMQYFILFTGVLLFVFYQFNKPPVYFDLGAEKELLASGQFADLQARHNQLFENNQTNLKAYLKNGSPHNKAIYLESAANLKSFTRQVTTLLNDKGFKSKVKPNDFVFITFILNYLPVGIIGLLLAVIFSAAMSSTSAEINSLATTSFIDIRKRFGAPIRDEHKEVVFTKTATLIWGIFAITFALIAGMFENLVEAVNILGSLFYGTVLGIFLASLYSNQRQSSVVLVSAIVVQLLILLLFIFNDAIAAVSGLNISFLWYNLIAASFICLAAFMHKIFS